MQFDPRLTQYLDYLDAMQAQRYAKGGKVVDLLAEILKGSSKAKPKPTKDQPDPGRRAALGLPKDVTPKPGEVVVKEKVKKSPKKGETTASITEAMNIPMSRRDVLRAGAGQAVSAMAPRGALGALMKAAASPSDLMEQVGKTDMGGGTGIMTIPGAIAKAMAMGLDEDQTIDMLKRMNLADESDVMYNLPVMANPLDFQVNIGDEFKSMGPREALGQMIGTGSGLDIRKSLREIMRENPDLYDQLKEVARDISDLSTEP